MGGVSHCAEIPMHPAIRERILQVSTDLRLRFLALSEKSGAKLNQAIALFEIPTPLTLPGPDNAERELAEAAATVLRLARERLVLWEQGEVPTLAEAVSLMNDLERCTDYLMTWLDPLPNAPSA